MSPPAFRRLTPASNRFPILPNLVANLFIRFAFRPGVLDRWNEHFAVKRRAHAFDDLAVEELIGLKLIAKRTEFLAGSSFRAAMGPGVGLARLHRAGAPSFGLNHDNYLASLRQENKPANRWGTFYAERRIGSLTERAAERGELPQALRKQIEQLIQRIPDLVGPEEPPARLHGDLWSGNVLCDSAGAPVLIDPAVYGGHREIDLAMMRLFGGFSEAVFDAYDEAFPLSPGHAERVPLYQLYPLLAHVNLFGSAYLPQLSHCIAALSME